MVPLSGLHALSRTIPGFLVSETHHGCGALPDHAHAHAGFCLVVDGGLAETRRGQRLAVRRGVLIARPAGDEHADRFDPGGATCLNIEVLGALAWSGAFTAGPAVWAATAVRAALLADDAPALEEACWRLVGVDQPVAGKAPAWLARIDQLVAARFAEPWSLAALAAEVGVGPAHLSRAYRRAHGTSVVGGLHRRRVDIAAGRLASAASLAEIAAGCGFCDQAYFTRVFRSVTGFTPAAYRRAQGADRPRQRAR